MAKQKGEPCPCDSITYQFPEYHWPHCRRNPKRIGAKDKLSIEPSSLMAVSQPPRR